MKKLALQSLLGLGVAVLLFCAGIIFPLQAALSICFGWAFFLADVVRSMKLSGSGVATAILTLTLLWLGFHRFARWLYAETTPSTPNLQQGEWPRRWTTAAVTMIILAFSAGISVVGLCIRQSG